MTQNPTSGRCVLQTLVNKQQVLSCTRHTTTTTPVLPTSRHAKKNYRLLTCSAESHIFVVAVRAVRSTIAKILDRDTIAIRGTTERFVRMTDICKLRIMNEI